MYICVNDGPILGHIVMDNVVAHQDKLKIIGNTYIMVSRCWNSSIVTLLECRQQREVFQPKDLTLTLTKALILTLVRIMTPC